MLKTPFIRSSGKTSALSPHLTGRAVRPPVEEGDGVAILCPEHRHDRPGPDLNTLLLVDSPSLKDK